MSNKVNVTVTVVIDQAEISSSNEAQRVASRGLSGV